jgi:predicted Fe-Mo cluster-binding NifX family protein
MKIAVATSQEDANSPISPKFGRAAYFLIFDGDAHLLDVIANAPPPEARGVGHRAADMLVDAGVTHVIAGHFGTQAAADLAAAGIEMFAHEGRAVDAVRELH